MRHSVMQLSTVPNLVDKPKPASNVGGGSGCLEVSNGVEVLRKGLNC